MKVTFAILALAGLLAYYVIAYHSPFQTEVTDPYFVEIRIDVPIRSEQLNLVGIGRMNSFEDCQIRSMLYWADMLQNIGKVKVSAECKKEVPEKFLKLFENQQATATYIAFDKGNGGERDARFLIYGAASGMAFEACEKFVEKTANNSEYQGRIYCVKGSIG